MKLLLLIPLALVVISSANADPADNGNWWQTQTPIFRQAYILGSLERLGKTATIMQAPAEIHTLINHAEVGQVCDGLDVFYQDFRNRAIHVQDGIDITLMAISGASQEEVGKAIAEARRRW